MAASGSPGPASSTISSAGPPRSGRNCAAARGAEVRLRILAWVGAAAWGGALPAHQFSITDVLVVLKTNGTYQIDMTVDVDALAMGVAPTTDSAELAAALEALSPAELDGASERASETLLHRVRIRFDGVEARPEVSFPDAETPRAEGAPPSVFGTTARFTGRVPEGAKELVFGASRAFTLVELTILDQSTATGTKETLRGGVDSEPYRIGVATAAPDRAAVVARYLMLGFEHILPKGVDHILFVLGLFLLSTKLRPLLLQVTAFTVAHTVTLALSMTNVLRLPSRPVETLIALSIAYVAIENTLTSELKPWRPALVFLFGLLHGLGFAGVLRELGLPEGRFLSTLLAFNCGVELGQLVVLGLAFAV